MYANKSKRTPTSSRTKKPAAVPQTPQRPLRFMESLAPAFHEKPTRRSMAAVHRNKRRKRSPPTLFLMDAAHLVEINLISAQALKSPPGSHRFQTYAVAWIDPAAKLRSAVDRAGGENPTWNKKFVFRVPAALLLRRANSSKLISTPPAPVAADLVLKECNRAIKGDDSNCGGGGGEVALCGLGFPRKIHASPLDQNLAMWLFHEKRSSVDGRF